MAEKTQSTRSFRRWLLRVVLFALGFTITGVVCAFYWSVSHAEAPDPRWAKPVLVSVALLGGVLSAVFGAARAQATRAGRQERGRPAM
jgi:hypothetical protein